MHQRLAEVTSERERRIAAARAEAEASAQAHMTFRPQLDGRSLRLAAGREAEREAAGGVARPKEASGGLTISLAWSGLSRTEVHCELSAVHSPRCTACLLSMVPSASLNKLSFVHEPKTAAIPTSQD